ncbi:MAG: hypothetical protein JST05_02305 [Acidobacteria bacterium]|nr:hypothetical protein [Acidobacteriota bacterium]
MAYLSWQEGSRLRRERLDGARILGSDPQRATLNGPEGSAAVVAMIQPEGGRWRIRALEGGVLRREGAMAPAEGFLLDDGDLLTAGAWEFRFNEAFPGLDGERFWETANPIPLPSGIAAAAALRWTAGQAQRLEQGLLAQEDPSALSHRIIEEARSFLGAETGAFVALGAGQMKVVHQAGPPFPLEGAAALLAAHAMRDGVSLLSNDALRDPRLPASPRSPSCGPVLVAPLDPEDQGQDEAPLTAFVLIRALGAPPFGATDLGLLRSAADLAALAHRLSLVQRRLLTQAGLESQVLHLQKELERQDERQGRLLAALGGAIMRGQALARRLEGPTAKAMHLHFSTLRHLVEEGQSTDPGLPPPAGRARALSDIQSEFLESWAPLAESLNLRFEEASAPAGSVWIGGGPLLEALHSLVDPLLLQLDAGTAIPMRWREEPGHHSLDLLLPPNAGRVIPDAWSRDALVSAGLDWRWSDGCLSLIFHVLPSREGDGPPRALLGLVTEDLALSSLFQGVGDAGDLGLFPLEETPPAAPLPAFEVVVLDAKGIRDPIACLRTYRAHPSFATTPMLVVRAKEMDGPELLSSGATDWMAGALRWESLHHRLQSLRRHRELQRKGRAAERLDTVRQMAGTLKHEINNPLAVISLQTELLQRKFPDEPKLGKIAEQVQRIQGLMQVLQKMREPGDEEYPGGTNILKL